MNCYDWRWSASGSVRAPKAKSAKEGDMIKNELSNLIERAATTAQERGILPHVAIPEASVERPQLPEHGDYASSIALKLARGARMKPLAIAETIVSVLPSSDAVARVWVAPPGFINFVLDDRWLARQVETILEASTSFGHVEIGNGHTVQVEFISANPTGPLVAVAGRGGSLGDALANILNAAGYKAQREYYLENAGSRMEAFHRSIYARYQQQFGIEAQVPDEGYHGEYLTDLAKEILGEHGSRYLDMPAEEAAPALGHIAMEKIIAGVKEDLARLGVHYERWFMQQQELFETSAVQRVIERLRQGGFLVEREGALWFTSSTLGEDKDNVVVRSNGIPTYFAADIAYHYNKLIERGFDRVVNIWGADHQGHLPRMRAGISALGIDPSRVTFIIHQMVTLKRGAEIVKMSKRAGHVVLLRDVLDEVGADACRFFFLSRSADSHMDFDLELAKKQSAENPVFYVQYAHARIASILRLAQDRGINYSGGDVSLLREPAEMALIRKMLYLPELVETAARALEPHHLPHYAVDLATAFHQFYEQCRVISDDQPMTAARLKLVAAAKTALANTLCLMGMSAPEQM
ncbi:MAG: arginine--tRNA ligase [Chloroflexi bacterium]|nr:arginine--tRNA ligase [Chloroflexota bacterium]